MSKWISGMQGLPEGMTGSIRLRFIKTKFRNIDKWIGEMTPIAFSGLIGVRLCFGIGSVPWWLLGAEAAVWLGVLAYLFRAANQVHIFSEPDRFQTSVRCDFDRERFGEVKGGEFFTEWKPDTSDEDGATA